VAAMTTVLTRIPTTGSSTMYYAPGHTILKPNLVQQSRRMPNARQSIATDAVSMLFGAADANSDILDERVRIAVNVVRPKKAITADVNAARDLFTEFVASDEFAAMVLSQAEIA